MCGPPTADPAADVIHVELDCDASSHCIQLEADKQLVCDSGVLECAICLETENECPGIIRMHRCTASCADDHRTVVHTPSTWIALRSGKPPAKPTLNHSPAQSAEGCCRLILIGKWLISSD